MNQPAPASSSSRANLSIDPNSAPGSRNLEYLLDDDDHEPKGGAGKIFVIILALLLAVGLGYLRWKDQGLGWLGKSSSKPPAAAEPADSPDSNASPAGNSPQPAASQPGASPNSTQPAPASNPPAAVSQPASTAANQNPAGSTPASAPDSASGKPAAPASSTPPASAPGKDKDNGDASATPADADKDSSAASSDASSAPAKPQPAAIAPKPAPLKPAPKPVDPVAEAQRYLYGKGVKQDCDRGLRILKPVADQSNPKAMIEMGALYSAGLCTPRDLPTSYRWFALALRKDPDNEALQGDLQKLWGEMTQPERQLAIRLSQ